MQSAFCRGIESISMRHIPPLERDVEGDGLSVEQESSGLAEQRLVAD
jgi:hypothetical protein